MLNDLVERLKSIDNPQEAIEIAPRIWWVGHYLPGDKFQCHCYLIEQGDQSVLVDPGSKLTFDHTLRKIEQVIPFDSIRYFLCQHQDPDITGAMPVIDEMISRDDAVLVTHWRTQMLLKHYGLKLPFWLVDENGWELALEDRTLGFTLTPYAHFPGAFVTLDESSRVLFSSDLFGGFTEEFSLLARDESYFEAMRPFHEHYMPSKEVLGYAMSEIEALNPCLIAPQHGSLIPKSLIQSMISGLMNLDCGLYLLARGDTNIRKLSRLNQALRDITQTMLLSREFREIADRLAVIIRRDLPVQSLEYFALFGDDHILDFSAETRYRGVEVPRTAETTQLLGLDRPEWVQWVSLFNGVCGQVIDDSEFCLIQRNGHHRIVVPLFDPDIPRITAIAVIHLSEEIAVTAHLEQVIHRLTMPLQVAIEREVIYRELDRERQKLYERSIHDPLTGLFTRIYMQDAVQRLCEIQDREGSDPVAALLLDIDHFKQVNDTLGHNQGDEVLKQVAALVLQQIRGGDIAVRLGGEEFVIFMTAEEEAEARGFAERLRASIEATTFYASIKRLSVTVSIGTAIRHEGEPLEGVIERADRALYCAKHRGRNRVEHSV
ncbi:diguanylate cyclase [Aestuariirhabdus sp. LZHN29]|uniref:diguanylate cyclase n=1 Tax=Aestuariirhabdus sp. LZHN29 TaxID=3417462 RepID=UPI003CECD62F